jgi:hypothetical protein
MLMHGNHFTKGSHELTMPLKYFTVQLEYAKKAACISNIDLKQALMEFTSFWRRIHNPLVLKKNNSEWSFDSQTPQWQELCTRINKDEPADRIAHEIYIRNDNGSEAGKQYFGCFRYDSISELKSNQRVVKIHFKNRDKSRHGPLSKEREKARIQDLKKMFEHISKNYREATVVSGGSWLYNLNSYKRLFPKSFILNMKVEEIPFPRTSGIWGQFIDSNGEVNEKIEYCFTNKVRAAQSIESLLQCFEFKILFASAAVEDFYNHFGIKV